MDEPAAIGPLREALEEARERVDTALCRLDLLSQATAPRYMRWRCLGCGYINKPMPEHVAPPCPKCEGETFESVP